MTQKDFVPYEPALELKELGFNESCFGLYAPPSKTVFLHHYGLVTAKEQVLAPTFSQAFRWMREKYGFYLIVQPSMSNDFSCVIWSSKSQNHIGIFKTYEEAELACLIKLIEIVKSQG